MIEYNKFKIFKLKLNYRIFLYFILFFLSSRNLALLTSENVIKNIDKNNISTDYLKNIPKNDYIIGLGDKLLIIVSREYPELTTQVVVDGQGTIYLPKLERIFVDGLSINELNNLLNIAFKKYVKFPAVESSILSYRPIRVLVRGEVENPGLQTLRGSYSVDQGSLPNVKQNRVGYLTNTLPGGFDLRQQMAVNAINSLNTTFYFPTLFDVIRESGGVTEMADLKNIKIIRKNALSNGGGKITTTINFENSLSSINSNENIRILDSDIIIIGSSKNFNNSSIAKAIASSLNPKYIEVVLSGRVANSGNIVVSKSSVLTDAIDIAGGTKVLKGPITFLRIKNNGTIDKRKFSLNKRAKRGSYKNPYLKNGDLIYVGESVFTSTTQVIGEVTAPMRGLFSTYGLIKAIADE